MRNRAIGLDIGTTAVRAVELSSGRGRPVVRRMGQVALPPGAVVAGEVVDPIIVGAALQRLWRAVGFHGRRVAVGVANARVVARVAELPDLSDDELRSSLPFHVADLMPMPVEELELDFRLIEHLGGRHVRALVVAAHQDMVRSLLAALAAANLEPTSIDLIPLALAHVVDDPSSWLDGDDGNHVVIGAGAGVTNVVVQRNGITEFVRTLPGGGALVTDALAAELGLDADDAEAVKRGLADGYDVEGVARRALRGLVYEIATSIDFHLNQLDDREVRQVVLAGGGARLPILRTMLEEQLGVPVVDADAYGGVKLAKLRIDRQLVASSGDVFAVAIGLALDHGVDLLPKTITAARAAHRQLIGAGAAVGLLVVGLGSATVLRTAQAHQALAAAEQSERDVAVLQAEVAGYHDVATQQAGVASRTTAVRTALQGDIAWTRVLTDVAASVPDNAWLTTFSANRATSGAAGAGPTVQITAKGFDQSAAAAWLQRAGSTGSLAKVWLTTSTAYDTPARPLVQFSSKASVTATSDRVAEYLGSAR